MTLKTICLTALATISLTVMAQKKQFTLDDLIPGGSRYYASSYPQNKYYTWFGDNCVELGVDNCKIVNKQTGTTETFIELKDLNEFLATNKRRTLSSLLNVEFPFENHPYIMTQVGNEMTLINFETDKIVWKTDMVENASDIDRNFKSMSTAYTLGHNLYVETANHQHHQVTKDGSADIVYGKSVHRDEFGISKGTFWSPDGKLLAFYRMDQSMVSKYPQVNVTPYDDSQCYEGKDSASINSRCATIEPDAYPMAGETSHKVYIGVFDPQSDKVVYLETGDPTDRYFTNIAWAPHGRSIYLIEVNRDQNHGSLDEYDAFTGKKLRTVFTEDYEKYFEPMHPIQFLPWDENKFIYQTRRDGFNHIYLYDASTGKQLKQLTKGNFEVIDVLGFNSIDKTVIYTSNERDHLQKNIYTVNMKGNRLIIGNSTGWHNPVLSKSCEYFIDNYSSPVIPRHIDIVTVGTNQVVNIHSAADPWNSFKKPEIKVGSIKAADGVTDLYYRLILPTDFDPNKKYPAIVYVYGGPHAHNIDASRSWGARGWDIYMAQKGYVMFCLDNRGSEHRGLAFEQSTFRNLGVEEMKDQLLGAEFLKSLPYVDGERLGVHGWSFGGFMTTSLMCRPDTPFKVGVAGGPVIDWKFYEVMYGERYMDTPQTNPEGYKNTSLLNKAKDLKGRLMVIYGGNDPTCVPQHTLSFMRACIDAGTYPDLFTYPGDGHNMMGTDRVHLHEVITRYFEDHLK